MSISVWLTDRVRREIRVASLDGSFVIELACWKSVYGASEKYRHPAVRLLRDDYLVPISVLSVASVSSLSASAEGVR